MNASRSADRPCPEEESFTPYERAVLRRLDYMGGILLSVRHRLGWLLILTLIPYVLAFFVISR